MGRSFTPRPPDPASLAALRTCWRSRRKAAASPAPADALPEGPELAGGGERSGQVPRLVCTWLAPTARGRGRAAAEQGCTMTFQLTAFKMDEGPRVSFHCALAHWHPLIALEADGEPLQIGVGVAGRHR